MEFQPDKKHLAGGLAGAVLLTAYLVYQGMSSPGSAYYRPEHAGHPAGTVYAANCDDCHLKAFQPAANEGCIFCHGKIPVLHILAPDKAKKAAAEKKETASDKLHKLLQDMACRDCHVEHRPSALDAALKTPKETRAQAKGFHAAIHGVIPPKYQGQDNCVYCHSLAELDEFNQAKR